MTERTSDESLMAAYVRGDSSAFAELFARYSPRLTRLFTRDLGRNEEAYDLVQQTFLQLHRARRDFKLGAALRPWLFTIALNLKRQYFRRQSRRPNVPLADEEAVASTEAGPEQKLGDAQLRLALDRLSENQRDVIVLHWFEGLSFKEVAAVVGASESAVKVRAHRGYQKLREIVKSDVTGPGVRGYREKRS